MNPLNDPATESAKAVQEVAKTTGKALDTAREAGGFISRFIAGPLEQGMGIFEDKLKYMRWENQQRFMERALSWQRRLGLSPPDRAVPLKIAVPLFQGAAIEEDGGLQDRWARLLINAAYEQSGIEVQRAYVEILSQLSPLEAKILDAVYALPFGAAQHDGIFTSDLPDTATLATGSGDDQAEPSDTVKLAIAIQVRIGCLRMGMTWGTGEYFRRITPTVLGRYFVDACHVQGVQAAD